MKKTRVLLTFVVSCLTLNVVANGDLVAEYIFSSDTVIQDGDYYSSIDVYDTPPDTTTVGMTGGEVGWLRSFDHNTINISGGRIIEDLRANDYSRISISGGKASDIYAWGHSAINISGGQVRDIMSWGEYCELNIGGGEASLIENRGTANVSGDCVIQNMVNYGGEINMSGGFIHDIDGPGGGLINITGGQVEWLVITGDEINISGGQITDRILGGGYPWLIETVKIYGYGFDYDYSGGNYAGGQLTGFWLDGIPFSIDFRDEESYQCVVLIPEPATLLLLGIGAAMLVRKRKA